MNKVNNRRVIRQLAFRELKNSRRMNVVVVLSIMLTCILFTALATVGGGLVNSVQQETMRQVGGSSMAGLKYVLPEDYEKVAADSAVRNVNYRIIVGQLVNGELRDFSAEVNCAGSPDAAKTMFSAPTTGRLPEAENEIAVSTIVLDAFALPHELGVVIPAVINVGDQDFSQDFILCGFWEGEKISPAQQCWVSRQFADKYAPTPSERYQQFETMDITGYWQVDFDYRNSWNIEGKTVALLQRLYGDSDEIPDVGVNWAFSTSTVDGESVASAAILLLLIFAAGYLIIFNIFHINISANIRSYGLLKTIGTTAKQIRRMVRTQALIYCAAGIPPGLICGILTGRLLTGPILETTNIHLSSSASVSGRLIVLIALFSAGFTLVTVLVSCRKPCRIAGSVSPIEALRYNETVIAPKAGSKKTGRISERVLARNNMMRSKKKTVIVVLSLSLSLVLLNLLFTALRCFDMDSYISNLIVGDFVLTHEDNYNDANELFKVTEDDVAYLKSMDGTAEVDPVYFQWGTLSMDGEPMHRLEQFCEKYRGSAPDEVFEFAAKNEVDADIYGIPDPLLKKMEPEQGTIDLEKWKTGNYAIVWMHYVSAETEPGETDFYLPGDKLTVAALDGGTKEFEVLAVCAMPYPLSSQRYSYLGGHVIIPESEYFALTDNRNAMKVMVNAAENRYDDVERQLRVLTDNPGAHVILKSKQTYAEEYGAFLNMLRLVGGTLCGILALIGILNFVNAVVTSIISRKREFAMMHAVGMTGRQLRAMLSWEGVCYVLLTTVCALTVSALLSWFLLRRFAEEMFFFRYHFTLLPVLLGLPVLLIFSVVIPAAAYRIICRDSIVDRLRENG
ncbi:MAG: ABC transporter permease [Oscillospiraceae bacterium]|nr:ABC transporter permease [Oscillospiraceae bacterium]